MENIIKSNERKRNPTLLSMLWLYGVVTASLIAASNLVLFFIFKNSQMLAISAGAVLCAGIFLIARWPQQKNRIYLAAFICSVAWVSLFIVHELFWGGILGFLVVGVWLLPAIGFFGLPAGLRRYSVFLPSLAVIIAIFVLEQNPLFGRILVTEFSLGRYITPIYFFILGVLFFQVVLRGFYTRLLATRMIASMATIVFIPIVILGMVTFSNTKLNDTLAAINSLDQIAAQKSEEIGDWSAELSNSLAGVLGTVDAYSKITELLETHARGDVSAELFYRQAVATILIETLNRSEYEEISIMDIDGIVLTSTRGDLIGSDYRYSEFFWQGKAGMTILPPRYYPLEDEVSIFISCPVLDPTGTAIGVLSGRVTADRIIEIALEPAIQPYQTTLTYLVNADGTLLITSSGRPTLNLQTDGAHTLVTTYQNGNDSYNNIDDMPVIGVYHWLPDLKVGILVEATEAEIYQRLPGIITSNLAIGILAFLLAAIAATTIVRSITNPINALVTASQDVIAGNLDIRVETDQEDELGILTGAFNKMTGELKVLVTGLESRVADRTRDLEQRSLELQTAAQIARDASLASNVNDLLNQTTRLIRERFGFYHVGIFLNDDNNEYAVLRAAGGDAGQVMLANNHKLKIGETGIVGDVSKSGEPRIALDVGVDSVHFRNPLLPYTRSEMALPLKTESRNIVVMDVQSD